MDELQKFLDSGAEYSLIKDAGQWTVDAWAPSGEHRWSKTFDDYTTAKAEYEAEK
jgi:hypothetical protein